MGKDLVCSSEHHWISAQGPTALGGLSAVLLLGVVAVKGNTGKSRSKCEKMVTEGFLDFTTKERPSSQTFILILLAADM